ncbi:hypothetical protein FO519_004486 [Halicephalobus sp. NKZ332]|nr:hypothetical protein FO519_004486 [Halicephalobus sp. NKZ332]
MTTTSSNGVIPAEGISARKVAPTFNGLNPMTSMSLYSGRMGQSSFPLPGQNVIDFRINNVVCNFALPMHVDLRKVAMNTWNVIFDRTASITKQKRHPSCFVKLQSSGKVFIVGCKSENECRLAARSIGRKIQKIMGKTKERVCLKKYRVCNIMATCKFPFGIQISEIARKYPQNSVYEPELSVGLEWKYSEPKASLRIHTTGTVTVTGATSEANVKLALEKIYEVIKDFRCSPKDDSDTLMIRKRPVRQENDVLGLGIKRRRAYGSFNVDDEEEEEFIMNPNRFLFDDEEDLDDDISSYH